MAKIDWESLTHEQRVKALADMTVDQIVEAYRFGDSDEDAARKLIGRETTLWSPTNVGEFKEAGNAPTKEVVLGAWRDLERSEALLELTDNSIDNWLRRREQYPAKTASELNIYIELDKVTHQLVYEDNAGGVPEERIENLVVPGFSETEPLSRTIGSYKTGGKKAIFRLATAASITTRFWNPAGSTDEAISIQLDQSWISNPTQYKFPYTYLKDKSVLQKGQTRFLLQLREEPIGGPAWFTDPDKIGKISKEFLRAYSLLLIRNPNIHIYFLDKTKPLAPHDFYNFCGTTGPGVDLCPQQVLFQTELVYQGQKHPFAIEVVLGCRTTVGVDKDGNSGGIDLYGNDRLFVAYDQTLFAPLLPSGNSRNLIRGFVNLKGPNTFIPWDTHKRHLNVDRDIINILTKHPLIVEFFENWRRAYGDISKAGVTKLIGTPLPKSFDTAKHDLFIPHRSTVPLDPNKKRGVRLPKEVTVPKVKASKKKNDTLTLRFQVTTNEARAIASYYQVVGDLHATASELGIRIKEDVLKRSKAKSR